LSDSGEGAPRTSVDIDLSDLRDRIMREMPDIRATISASQYGVRVDSLTPQLREFFGVRTGTESRRCDYGGGRETRLYTTGIHAPDTLGRIDSHAHNHPRQTGARNEARRGIRSTDWTPPQAYRHFAS